jgi:NAD(P)-dependent dehydrogenase (short-subunit alcohol dehydrogenase family)
VSAGEGRLAGRVAVVTGSSTGNGRAIALALAGEGARVICTDLQKSVRPGAQDPDPRADVDTDDLIRERGGEAEFLRADVTVEADVVAAATQATISGGRLDIWVNNAGVAAPSPIGLVATELWQRTFEINVLGTWLGCAAAVEAMRRQERRGRSLGRIINMGSITAVRGQGQAGIYSASKGAVHALTRDLAIELAPELINVNALAPGYFTETAMFADYRDDPAMIEAVLAPVPWPETAPTSDLGAAAAFLASEEAAWITGAVLPIDGGIVAG